MPQLRRALIAALIVGLGLPAAAAAAGTPPAAQGAPGRIVLQVDDGRLLPRTGGIGGGFQPSVGITKVTPLPDGSTLLFGTGTAGYPVVNVTKIGPGGALDRTFGAGGMHVLNAPGGQSFTIRQILPQRDGKLLFVGTPDDGGLDLQVRRMNADLSLDRTYGVDGIAKAPIVTTDSAAGAVQQPDGAVVLLGQGEPVPLPATPERPATVWRPWALTRITAGGTLDRSFGTNGVATIVTNGFTSARDIALGPGGTILTSAGHREALQFAGKVLLTRLTTAGAPDPSFAGGTPVEVPTLTDGGRLFSQPDGAVVVAGSLPVSQGGPSTARLARYGASGARDFTYGSGGFAELGSQGFGQILPAGDGALLVTGAPAGFRFGSGGLRVMKVLANGSIDPRQARSVDLRFGGGVSSSPRVPPVAPPSLYQDSFRGALVERADGSYLVAGAVDITLPGSGAMGRWAVAALTPAFELDPSFGGHAAPLRLSATLVRQSSRRARARRSILVDVQASAIGLAQIRVTHGRRAIASSVVAVLGTDRTRAAVELTRHGYAFLRRHRNLRVVVRAIARDLLATSTTSTARGRLR